MFEVNGKEKEEKEVKWVCSKDLTEQLNVNTKLYNIFTTDINSCHHEINFPSSVYVKKIGYVSSDTLKIKINEKNICNIRVEELTEKFNNSISDYF